MIRSKIEKIKGLRHSLLQKVEGLSEEQLNTIPPPFNNNIIWHLGHLVSSLQRICYFRSGLPMPMDDKFIAPFTSGTKPEKHFGSAEISDIKAALIASVDQLLLDLDANIFISYQPSELVKAVYGITLADIGDAVDFILYHEGLHAGNIQVMMKLV